MVRSLQNVLDQAYHQHFPLVVRKRSANDKPWINDKIKADIQNRQQAFERGDLASFRSIRNQIQRAIVKLKSTFYRSKIAAMKNSNPGTWHRQIRSLAGLSKRTSYSFPDDFGILSRQITSTTSLQVYALNYLLSISRLARPTYLPEDHHPTFNASGSFKRWRSLILLKLSILKILLFDWSKNSPWRSLLRYLPSSILFWSRVLSHRVGNVPL